MDVKEWMTAIDFEALTDEELNTIRSTVYNIKEERREALRLQLIKNLEQAWKDIEDAGMSIELKDSFKLEDDCNRELLFCDLSIY